MDLKEIFEKSKSVEVIENTDGTTEIRINRKSRFIRNDAEKIMEKCRKAGVKSAKITLKITAPLCSKAKKLLQENGYQVS